MKIYQCVVIFISILMVKGAFYSAASNEKVSYKDEIGNTESPSLISCTLFCRRLNGSSIAIFEMGNCRCVIISDDQVENDKEDMLGNTFTQPVHIKLPSKWRKIEIVGQNELKVVQDNLVKTISKLTKEYILSLEFKRVASSQVDYWYNLFHMTTGENNMDYGSRTPGAWINNDIMNIHSAVNLVNGGFVCGVSISKSLNVWQRLKISQLKDSDDIYRFSVEIDGKVVHSVVNNNPADFDNVKCYIAHPWNENVDGFVKNFWVKIHGLWF